MMIGMSERADVVLFVAPDGSELSAGSAASAQLRALVADPAVRSLLIAHGLDVERSGDQVRLPMGSLRSSLTRLSEELRDGPIGIRQHSLLRADRARAVLEMLTLMASSADSVLIQLPLGDESVALRAVPRPEDPRDILLRMQHVAPESADSLLHALDDMLDQLTLDGELLLRALKPLLGDERTCGMAARILGRAETTEAIGALEHALARTTSLDNRIELLMALMRLGNRALGMRTLRSILIHGSAEARWRAVMALSELATHEDRETLHDMMRLAPRTERLAIAAALYRLGDPRSYAVIARGLERLDSDSTVELVQAALDGVESIGSRRFIAHIEAYAERETRDWFRTRARGIARRLERHGIPEATPDALLEQAEQAYFANRRAEATERLDELLALEPHQPHALYLKANCLKEEGRVDQALRLSGMALAVDPGNWRLHRLRGSLLWDSGRPEAALEAYDRALARHPIDAYTWYYKGDVLYRLQRYEEALPCLDRALSLKSDSPYIYNQKAFCLERLDRHAEAAACYRRSLRLDASDLFTREYLGQALQTAGQLDEALSCFDAVLKASPTREDALYRRADVLYDLELWAESEQAFAAYVELRPDSFNACFNRGLCLRFLGRWVDASDCFERALELRPDSASARRHLAYCRAR